MSDCELPLVSWNESNPGVYLTAAAESDRSVLDWVTKTYVYDIGSFDGCACALDFEPLSESPGEKDIRAWNEGRQGLGELAKYLRRVVPSLGDLNSITLGIIGTPFRVPLN